ncbi:MAG TPA: ribonuclease H-like YkuK family protein [Bacillota bacterium]|nr:ribonuclease H-like YkuK family protein [Bacillota bacterium]
MGSGFSARIKPDSFGASTVADRFTKGGSRKA